MKKVKKVSKKNSTSAKKSIGFTAEEKAAMKERVREQKMEQDKANGEEEVLAKIASMKETDRRLAKRIHSIVTANAPSLSPRLWYGMPAYTKDDKVVCFFQDANKFKYRYATLGFQDKATLDEGNIWPVAFALKELTPADEAKIAALVKKGIS